MKLPSLLAASTLLTLPCLGAEIIYENASNYEGLFNDTALESGDQVSLAGDARYITGIAFEYFASFAVRNVETARVRFYYNDGPEFEGLKTPGTLFYDSGPFSIDAGYRTIRNDDLGVFVDADSFTWTVEFSGLESNESAGLLYYDPPTVGSSGDFFWQKSGDSWEAVSSVDAGNNFAAQFLADPVLKITAIAWANAQATVSADAVQGRRYALEGSSTLAPDSWTRLAEMDASSAVLTFQVNTGSEPLEFFRVLEIPN